MTTEQRERLDKIILWLNKRVVPSWKDAQFMAELCVSQDKYIEELEQSVEYLRTWGEEPD
jgi:hypothetical protein